MVILPSSLVGETGEAWAVGTVLTVDAWLTCCRRVAVSIPMVPIRMVGVWVWMTVGRHSMIAMVVAGVVSLPRIIVWVR